MKIYARKHDLEVVQTAKLKLLGIGKYAFETSFLGQPYELNMNMPLFDKEHQAITWIKKQAGWTEE